MHKSSARLRSLLPLLLIAASLTGCASSSRLQVNPQPVMPRPPAALMLNDSADSASYSARVRAWQSKVVNELNAWLQTKPPCKSTSPGCV